MATNFYADYSKFSVTHVIPFQSEALHASALPQSKILSPVENSKNTKELKMHSNPGIKNTILQLSGLERSESILLAASNSLPLKSTPIIPASVPAVFETPITIPAYLGAISM
ncbi:hypothetical protein PanWU01x14_283590 [Parasponia andersonii]|uniref:Uncharacterized protein n=1 Tax=Parasponia andersonii TaxID=3476 RepID=A0A2P5B0C0_PARAD|nr:hypothetical protein PanWU01x14_283590 [Parasponia andersonii]